MEYPEDPWDGCYEGKEFLHEEERREAIDCAEWISRARTLKYELTEAQKYAGTALYRIRALKSFRDIKEGDFGGWVESPQALSQSGDCWISKDAIVVDRATIKEDARISDNAIISGDATISGQARVEGEARIGDYAIVRGHALVGQLAAVRGHAIVEEEGYVGGTAVISGKVIVRGSTHISGKARVQGHTVLSEGIIARDAPPTTEENPKALIKDVVLTSLSSKNSKGVE